MPPQILPLLGSSSAGSNASAKMQSRDHPFNRSTRPLLERRAQPQVVSTKKLLAAQGGTQGPKVPTRGYNDFNLISRQYETWNSNHSHQGYPYGSPPSPTHDSGPRADFQFSDIVDGPQRVQLHQRTVHQYTVNSNNSDEDDDDDDDYDELVYHHNQLNAGGAAGTQGLKTANQQLRRRLLDAASPMPPPVPPQRTVQSMQQHRTPPPPPRRTESPPMAATVRGLAEIDGPFVFGVHHPNTFTPAYGTKATLYGTNTTAVSSAINGGKGKDANDPSSPDTSQTDIRPPKTTTTTTTTIVEGVGSSSSKYHHLSVLNEPNNPLIVEVILKKLHTGRNSMDKGEKMALV
uniref:Uncharacterized protein n=1 Tax=Anopheles atroparvus TaxID=41427 RepID=A0A182JE83_ANOAO